MTVSLIVLAAGQGTRMKSDLPKVLHEIAHAPLLHHALDSATSLKPTKTVVVVGNGAEDVTKSARAFDADIATAVQDERLGTAHAVAQANSALEDTSGDAIVLYGDTPFIEPETLQAMVAKRSSCDVVVLGFEAADPGRYGRLILDGDRLCKIVEFKDATDEERAITLCNSGVVCAERATLFDLVAAVGNDNAAGEFYLTDIVAIANSRGLKAGVVVCDEAETQGIDSRGDLAAAEATFQAKRRTEALADGVTLAAPDTVMFAYDTVLGRDVVVEPNVVFGPGVTVETGARIRAFSHLEGCHVSSGGVVGPYARLRPGAELAANVKIGNFVEVKAAQIGQGSKVNHLSYIGDAEVGERTNIGAGSVTCNYDGVFKHKTTIGNDVFVGSDTMLVAPVSLGDGAMTASGSVITDSVPAGALGLGRARQVVKHGLATKLFAKLRDLKRKKTEGQS